MTYIITKLGNGFYLSEYRTDATVMRPMYSFESDETFDSHIMSSEKIVSKLEADSMRKAIRIATVKMEMLK